MKRIFLTSGLVLCMACPAFAEVINGNTVESPDCSQPTLNGTSGTSTFTAQWSPIWHTITLNEDDYDATDNTTGIGIASSNIGTDGGALTTANTLYSEQNKSGVYKGFTGTVQAGTFELTNFTDSTVITTLPNGKDVTYSITTVTPSGATGSPTYPSITGATRASNGFWKDVSGTNTQMITDQGVLTEAGKTAASSSVVDQTWNAEYKCATPTFANVTDTDSTTPVWAGYTFLGYTATNEVNDTTYITPGCIEADTPLYARWSAQQFHITYTCGTAEGTSAFTTATTGASTNVVSDAINMDGSYTLAADQGSCVLPGYHFKGWNCGSLTEPTSTNGVVESGVYAGGASGKYSYAGDVTCSVVWEANTITLMSSNGFGGEPTSAGTCDYDGTITMPAQPTRNGYEFTGWAVVNTPAN